LEDVALLAKIFLRRFKKKSFRHFRLNKFEKGKNYEVKQEIKCYGYGKPRHIHPKCPKAKKEEKMMDKKKKKKVLSVWSDKDSSSSSRMRLNRLPIFVSWKKMTQR